MQLRSTYFLAISACTKQSEYAVFVVGFGTYSAKYVAFAVQLPFSPTFSVYLTS